MLRIPPGNPIQVDPRSKRAKRGFTLIELLVVIAIIAILAAILFPVFARARENARRASCQSNMKQMGLGIMQYSQDYDERYVPRVTRPPGLGELTWRAHIQPYVKSTQLFRCPSNTSTAVSDNYAPFAPGISTNYAINPRISGEEANGISLSAINSVAQKIHVSELRNAGWSDYPGSGWGVSNYGDLGFAGHLTTANYLFADGHVKAMKPTATSTPFNMFGSFNGGSTNGDCNNTGNGQGINCDEVETLGLQGMQDLESKFK